MYNNNACFAWDIEYILSKNEYNLSTFAFYSNYTYIFTFIRYPYKHAQTMLLR